MLNPLATDVDSLGCFEFIRNNVPELKEELATYLAKADGVADVTIDVLQWWKGYENELKAWASTAKKVLVVQPSAERVFSLLNNTFNEQQDNTLQDYVEASIMLQYNSRKIDSAN